MVWNWWRNDRNWSGKTFMHLINIIKKLKCRIGWHDYELKLVHFRVFVIFDHKNEFPLPERDKYIKKCKYCGKEKDL